MADFTYSEENIFPYTRFNTSKKNPFKKMEGLFQNRVRESWNEKLADDSTATPEELEELTDEDFEITPTIPGVEVLNPAILARDDYISANEVKAQFVKIFLSTNGIAPNPTPSGEEPIEPNDPGSGEPDNPGYEDPGYINPDYEDPYEPPPDDIYDEDPNNYNEP